MPTVPSAVLLRGLSVFWNRSLAGIGYGTFMRIFAPIYCANLDTCNHQGHDPQDPLEYQS